MDKQQPTTAEKSVSKTKDEIISQSLDKNNLNVPTQKVGTFGNIVLSGVAPKAPEYTKYLPNTPDTYNLHNSRPYYNLQLL